MALALFLRSPGCWELWQDSGSALIDSLRALVTRGAPSPASRAKQPFVAALWLLDRLLPLDVADPFAHLAEECFERARQTTHDGTPRLVFPEAVLAWGRRLDARERLRLPTCPITTCRAYQAALAAWCDTCPPDAPESLFDWAALVDAHSGRHHWDASLLVRAYAVRVGDAQARSAGLWRVARRAFDALQQPEAPRWGVWPDLLASCVGALLQDLARTLPPPDDEVPGTDAEAQTAFLTMLRAAGQEELAELCRAAGNAVGLARLPARLWVERHDASVWERFVEDFDEVEERLPYAGIEHLGRIVPPDRIDAWERALELDSRGNVPITAFCQWLRPEYRDVLLRVVARSAWDDVGACAWQAYLHKTPRPVLEMLWREAAALPMQQAAVLDRLLHAPAAVRPPPVVWDTQAVEADPRLEDPLNHRAF